MERTYKPVTKTVAKNLLGDSFIKEVESFCDDFVNDDDTPAYTFKSWKNIRNIKHVTPCSYAIFEMIETGWECEVEIVLTQCPECGGKAIAYGWAEGGAHVVKCENCIETSAIYFE